MGFYRIAPEQVKEAVVWVAHYTGWGYKEIMGMPVITLVEWFDSVKLFHGERLTEQQSILQTNTTGKRKMPDDPMRDFI